MLEAFTKLPFACAFSTSLSVRTYGVLNGSGKAPKLNPKLSSMVSFWSSTPDSK